MVHAMEPEDPPRKIYTTKPREFERVNAPPGSKVGKSTEHDVYAILQQNRSVERKAGLNEVEIRPVRSRRKRDYWLLLVPGNALFGLVGWIARDNVVVLVSAGAGMVVFSLGLTWVMWFVMNDY
jgi:predicted phage tail protein